MSHGSAAPTPRSACRLDLLATQPVLLQGVAGFSRKGPLPQQASHYYSLPQLSVQALLAARRQRTALQGRAWLDHEWSDEYLPPEAVGWDWIGFNLDDGGALMAFRLRRADGSALWAGGSHRGADGHVRSFAPDELRFMPQTLVDQRRFAGALPGAVADRDALQAASRCVRSWMRRNSTAA